ncbi:response regulator, partial [Streptomyces sp. NPDC056831]|uniref:response regulator n=1 Tax=Streptomyces sp. NPDC056831 TaxID=3345954 RepID=UPI0036A74540
DLTTVAQAGDGEEALRMIAQYDPDVVLMDIRMPGTDGLAATRMISADPELAAVRVVMLTTFGDEGNVLRALRDGASGFLLKDEGPQELISAVRAAAAGDAVLSPGVTGAVIARMLCGGISDADGVALQDERIARLTVREREVLAMLGEGLSNQDIADRLTIVIGTVKTHVGAILEKTGSTSRVQAALLAHRAGLRP